LGLAAASAQAGNWDTALTSQIAARTALPDKDVPVLSVVLDEIGKGL
jgi:hypothetical protein